MSNVTDTAAPVRCARVDDGEKSVKWKQTASVLFLPLENASDVNMVYGGKLVKRSVIRAAVIRGVISKPADVTDVRKGTGESFVKTSAQMLVETIDVTRMMGLASAALMGCMEQSAKILVLNIVTDAVFIKAHASVVNINSGANSAKTHVHQTVQ